MKYTWRVLLASQFAIMAFFIAPFPFAGLIFQGIGFVFDKRIILLETAIEIPLNNINRSISAFFLQIIWDLPVPFFSRLIVTSLVALVFFIVSIATSLGICFCVSLLLKRTFRKYMPDIWASIR